MALPFEGSVEITGASAHVDGVVLELASWTRAVKPYRYEPKSRALAQLPFVAPGAYDAPQDIVAREVRYASHDGVQVPLSIVARSDVKLDGTNPTIVYGYGAYGATEDPFFNPRIYAWIQRGGVFAFAHVRGGGAFGEEWHLAGRKATKPNTWKDTIAAAEWLVANKYTSPKQIGVYGGSAGGILVGRAITERPDLFAAADERMAKYAAQSIPLGRWGTPGDIGNMVAFLASPGGDWITGAILVVDGGEWLSKHAST